MYDAFFRAIEKYKNEAAQRYNELDPWVSLAEKRKGKTFCPNWWHDKTGDTWYDNEHPGENFPGQFRPVYCRLSDRAVQSKPPPDAIKASDHPEEVWAWPNTAQGYEDSYTAWKKTQKIFSESVSFATYLLHHRERVTQWLTEHLRTDDGAYHLREDLIREFSKKASVTGPLHEPEQIQRALQSCREEYN